MGEFESHVPKEEENKIENENNLKEILSEREGLKFVYPEPVKVSIDDLNVDLLEKDNEELQKTFEELIPHFISRINYPMVFDEAGNDKFARSKWRDNSAKKYKEEYGDKVKNILYNNKLRLNILISFHGVLKLILKDLEDSQNLEVSNKIQGFADKIEQELRKIEYDEATQEKKVRPYAKFTIEEKVKAANEITTIARDFIDMVRIKKSENK